MCQSSNRWSWKLDRRRRKISLYSKSWKNMDTCAKDIHCERCLKRSQAWKSKCRSTSLNPKLYIKLFFYRCAYFVGKRVSVSLWWCEIHFGPGQPNESTSMCSWVVHRCCGWARVQQRRSRHNCSALAFRLITEQAQSQSAPYCCIIIGGVQFPLLFLSSWDLSALCVNSFSGWLTENETEIGIEQDCIVWQHRELLAIFPWVEVVPLVSSCFCQQGTTA